jgi:hypothetical protein
VALSPNPYEAEVAQSPIIMRGLIRSSNRINDVVCRIQRNPRTEMVVVHLDRLTPYEGTARQKRP